MDYGRRFRFYRDRIGLTQKEAAEQLGITPYQLGNYETNRSEPNIGTLKKMSQIYHVSLDQLLCNRWTPSHVPLIEEMPQVDMDEVLKDLEKLVKRINERQP